MQLPGEKTLPLEGTPCPGVCEEVSGDCVAGGKRMPGNEFENEVRLVMGVGKCGLYLREETRE
jgi:hypothetical protein